MSTTIASSTFDAILAKECFLAGVSVKELHSFVREGMEFIGDQAGVDLRGLADEPFRLFECRFFDLSVLELHRRGFRAAFWEDVPDDVYNAALNDAAWQAVQELFVAEGDV